ncbi:MULTISPECIES: hypothetical protein [unclassified Shewanella]|uniref:HTH-like domain-containing protein n=1 Tax=unclassified Shewanella TaxID=196818 RepID=UPI00354F1470
MSTQDLVMKLSEMYQQALKGEKSTMVHLFGVRYATEIRCSTASPKEIAQLANISENYGVEINKGIKLSKYLVEKS